MNRSVDEWMDGWMKTQARTLYVVSGRQGNMYSIRICTLYKRDLVKRVGTGELVPRRLGYYLGWYLVG